MSSIAGHGTRVGIVILACARLAIAEPEPNTVVLWNQAALQAVRDGTLGPPMVARALAIVHTCMYDAWAAYDEKAIGTQLGGSLRTRPAERTPANKAKAISFAAYRAAVDLFPWDTAAVFDPLMVALGYDIQDLSTDTRTPSGIGNLACDAVLAFRHNDGSNQLGNLTASGVPYADYTGYVPKNLPSIVPVNDLSTIIDPNHWQPLTYFNGTKVVTPSFVGAQWYKVTPFALSSPDELLPFISSMGPASFGSQTYADQAQELVNISAQLTDEQKMIAEYWANGPHSELPPGHWDLFAQYVSTRDHHTLDDDAKMFFALTNAIFDAGIAAWDAKRVFDSVRPVTAIPYLLHGQLISCWGGPGRGTVREDGSNWIPYQPSTFPTPPFPEYISGHSIFSAAGATILALWTSSEEFGASVTFAPGSSVIEPGITPAHTLTLHWKTFHDAANQAGISRRYGGIHFQTGDLVGRATGDIVGARAWEKAREYFNDTSERQH
ncbi:MAG TPA: vanadium-dependent haloperoxidase [Bryobacteraceae bacterium]|nr:vanadium-dependent haloperoxidase [Bryobacteraceae bacterium]